MIDLMARSLFDPKFILNFGLGHIWYNHIGTSLGFLLRFVQELDFWKEYVTEHS